MKERITGFHAIEEALKSAGANSILYLCRNQEKRNSRLESLAKNNPNVRIRKIAAIEMDRLSGTPDHRGALLELSSANTTAAPQSVSDFLATVKEDEKSLVVVLDGITDVHNLGAILRSCDQFSVDLVVIPQRRSAQQSSAVHRVSSGASQHVPLVSVSNIVREIELLQKNGYWAYGADMEGENLHTTRFSDKTVLILGSEGEGLSQLVRKRCDYIVSIPTTGHIDSLNVSVAAGILLYEFRRQKR